MILKYLQKLQRIAWYIMIASLPLTSMPLVKKLLGSDSVASPAVVFLLILVFFWIAGLIFRDKLRDSTKILTSGFILLHSGYRDIDLVFLQNPGI